MPHASQEFYSCVISLRMSPPRHPLVLKILNKRRGFKPKPTSNRKTLANRAWLKKRINRELDPDEAPQTVRVRLYRVRRYSPVPHDQRKRGPAISTEDLITLYKNRHRSFATAKGFALARGNVGVYMDKLRMLKCVLRKNLEIQTYRMGAFVNCKQALATYLHLVEANGVLWPGDFSPRLALFMDACSMFGRPDSNLISCFLPQARHPHQQLLNLALGRFIGWDCAWNYGLMMRAMGLFDVLRWVNARGIDKRPVVLVLYVDWKCLCMILGWPGPGDELCCPFCWAQKCQWKTLGFSGGPPRSISDWTHTPLRPFLDLFQCVDDIGHCSLHNVALCMSHGVVHALLIWARAKLPMPFSDALLAFYARYFPGDNVYTAPAKDKITLDDWTINGKTTKKVLRDDKFWEQLGDLIPRVGEPYGVTVRHSLLQSGQPISNPIHLYLKTFRRIMLDTISFKPKWVRHREGMCLLVHRLFFMCGLPSERYNCAMHVQLFHYASPLRRHGNLVSMNGEGGEKHHQPHKRISGTDNTFIWGKCPPAVKRCVEWSTDNIALWRAHHAHPDVSASYRPTLPSN